MPFYQLFSVSIVVFVLLINSLCAAQTIGPVNCSYDAVQAAVENARDGDVILVNPGASVWNKVLILPTEKRITLKGAGMEETVITGDLPTYRKVLLNLGRSASRVTGFGFNDGTISAGGRGWRVDHCRFFNSGGTSLAAVTVWGGAKDAPPTGLVDHCRFEYARFESIPFAGLAAHDYWAVPLELGSVDNVFVEDCEFTRRKGNAADSQYGASYVFRYNRITGAYIEAHSLQTGRGTRSWEIYHNQVSPGGTVNWTPMFLRGGTGVVFNNEFLFKWQAPDITIDNMRSYSKSLSLCNGGDPMDGNQPVPQGEGTHTGANAARVLVDASKNWASDQFFLKPDGIYVYNLTSGQKAQIKSYTKNTIVFEETGILWNNGDRYKITDGYPCRDQIGRSTDAWLWTDQNPFPPQTIDPAHFWGNRNNETPVGVSVHNGKRVEAHIVQGRDYHLTFRPNYIPYPYPHPFAVDDPAGQSLQLSFTLASGLLNLTWNRITGAANYRIVKNWMEDQAVIIDNPDQTQWETVAPSGRPVYMVYACDGSGKIISAEGVSPESGTQQPPRAPKGVRMLSIQ